MEEYVISLVIPASEDPVWKELREEADRYIEKVKSAYRQKELPLPEALTDGRNSSRCLTPLADEGGLEGDVLALGTALKRGQVKWGRGNAVDDEPR